MKLNRCNRALCAWIILLAGIAIPSQVFGEAGDGVQAGNYNLSFGLRLATSYNSNLFSQSDNAPEQPSTLEVPVTLSANLITKKPRLVDVKLAWEGGGNFFISSEDEIQQQSGFSTSLNGSLLFNQKGTVSFLVEETFTRTNEPPNTPVGDSINRVINRTGATLGVHPGGRVLQGYLGYAWEGHFFNDFYDDLNKDEHAFSLRGAWKFLPRTALFLDTEYRLVMYDVALRGQNTNSELPNVDSTPLRIKGGLNGLILRNLSAQLSIGYGWAFYETGPSFSGILADAIFQYFIGPEQTTTFIAGYSRSFNDSPVGNAATNNEFKLGVEQLLLNKTLTLSALAGLELRSTVLPPSGEVNLAGGATGTLNSEVNDQIVNATFGATWALAKWMNVGASYRLRANLTDDRLVNSSDPSAQVGLTGRDFTQHVVSGFVGFKY